MDQPITLDEQDEEIELLFGNSDVLFPKSEIYIDKSAVAFGSHYQGRKFQDCFYGKKYQL